MIFEKDPKVRYVDMAIYIDNHIYTDNYDAEKVYQYLYFLIYMLAKKKKYFDSEKSYDDFSLWFATKMFVRLTDKKQFDESGKLAKIKSVLNYIKGILYAKKVEYNTQIEYQTTIGKFNSKYIDDFDDDALTDYYRSTIESHNNDIIRQSIIDMFEDIPQMFCRELIKSPYKKDKVVLKNLYLSCLLTFIKSTTISNTMLKKIDRLSLHNPNIDIFAKLDEEPKIDEIVLWKLPKVFSPYVEFIYKRVKKQIVNEIKDSIHQYAYSLEELHSVINSTYETVKERD